LLFGGEYLFVRSLMGDRKTQEPTEFS